MTNNDFPYPTNIPMADIPAIMEDPDFDLYNDDEEDDFDEEED